MSPPDLAADTPVLNVLQPLRVNLLPMRREKSDQMLAHHRERFLRLWIPQKPLLAYARFDWDFAAIAEAHVVLVGLGFCQQPTLLQNFRSTFARFKAIEPM